MKGCNFTVKRLFATLIFTCKSEVFVNMRGEIDHYFARTFSEIMQQISDKTEYEVTI